MLQDMGEWSESVHSSFAPWVGTMVDGGWWMVDGGEKDAPCLAIRYP